MPTQDLVPDDQPYGSRQDNVAGLKQAGLPVSSDGVGSGSPIGGTTASAPGPAPAGGPGLDSFDALANREPTPEFTPAPRRQVLYERVRQSDNQILQSIFQRMDGYRGT